MLSFAVAVISFVAAANTTPVASFSAYRLPGGAEPTVLLDASASTDSDGQIVSYQWVFGDGTSGSGVEAEHTFPDVDRYNVRLLTIDDGGSWHMITQTVDVSVLPLWESGSVPGTPTPQEAMVSAAASGVPIGAGVGQRAPDFSLPDLGGRFVNLSDFLGRVVLVEFWKSSCPGCLASVPHLEALRVAYEAQGLVVLLISLDDSARDTQRFLTEKGYAGFVVVRETRGFLGGTTDAYGVKGTPTAFLIDRTGVIRHAGSPSAITDELVTRWL
jgi:peroxiredoxin